MSHPALTQLRALRYFDQIPALDPQQLDWLLLEDSMTKRFEQQGKTVTVTLIQEGFVSGDEIANELPLLPPLRPLPLRSRPPRGPRGRAFALSATALGSVE